MNQSAQLHASSRGLPDPVPARSGLACLFGRERCRHAWFGLLFSCAAALTVNAGRASDTFLEFEPVWGTNSLRLEGSPLRAPDGSLFTVSRLDLLISEVALQAHDPKSIIRYKNIRVKRLD